MPDGASPWDGARVAQQSTGPEVMKGGVENVTPLHEYSLLKLHPSLATRRFL